MKRKKHRQEELLEVIRRKKNLEYISDIPYRLTVREVWSVMEQVPRKKYSKKEWADAVYYCLVNNKN